MTAIIVSAETCATSEYGDLVIAIDGVEHRYSYRDEIDLHRATVHLPDGGMHSVEVCYDHGKIGFGPQPNRCTNQLEYTDHVAGYVVDHASLAVAVIKGMAESA